MALTIETLVRCGVPAPKARAHLPFIRSAMREHGITSPIRARMFLAQVMHESLALRFFEEIASGADYEGRADLGNTRPGDGRRFKGRGPIQLTGRGNYTLYGKLLGLDLVGHPEIAATPRVGWRTAALFFQRRGCNQAADRRDFREVTRLINGGYNGYDDRVRYYRLLGGVGVVPGRAYLGRGDSGDGVATMTRRLSFVRARATGRPYLDGKRRRFDEEAEDALEAFQADHDLKVDGRYGADSARRLARATENEKRRRARERGDEKKPTGGGKKPTDGGKAPEKPNRGGKTPERPERTRTRTSAEILDGLERLDVRGDRLRAALLKRRRTLERALERAEAEGVDRDDLRVLGEHLTRLDVVVHDTLGAIAAAERPHPAAVQRPEPAVPGTGGNGGNGGTATKTATAVAVAPEQATEVEALGIDELAERLVALNAEDDRVRALLAERFQALEREVRRRGRHERRTEPARPKRRPKRTRPPRPRPESEDGPGGEATTVPAESKSFAVKQSKVALAGYLRRHRRQTTRALCRTLLREVRSPKNARVATPAWQRAVREAQAIAGLPVTGKLDGKLQKRLKRDWPSESALRRIVRGTPAWRLIRGQLSPNFNIREFGCNDGTPYVSGLIREQGVTKDQARRRAKELADRLERVRTAEGNRALRPSSVFRTQAWNARQDGAVKNSAHTRGFAADVPPPSGVSLAAHHRHMLAVFPRVGLYASFVHGDSDPSLPRGGWNG